MIISFTFLKKGKICLSYITFPELGYLYITLFTCGCKIIFKSVNIKLLVTSIRQRLLYLIDFTSNFNIAIIIGITIISNPGRTIGYPFSIITYFFYIIYNFFIIAISINLIFRKFYLKYTLPNIWIVSNCIFNL